MAADKAEVLQGTLDLMILKTLQFLRMTAVHGFTASPSAGRSN